MSSGKEFSDSVASRIVTKVTGTDSTSAKPTDDSDVESSIRAFILEKKELYFKLTGKSI